MNRAAFRQRLMEAPLLLDGAMGTALHSRGIQFDQCFDALNVRQPALVADVHRRYIEAGADMLETNSFGGNAFRLHEHGLHERVAEINAASVQVARRVIASAFKPILLAGSVGPLGVRLAPLGRVSVAQAQEAFSAQIAALLQPPGVQGVDVLILETMSDLFEVKAAVDAARALSAETPIIAFMTFSRDDRTLLGQTAADVAARLSRLDVDMIGVNCSGGPAQVLRLIAIMHQAAPDTLLGAVPNAGWPQQTERGRVIYPATPAYFADYARAFVAAGARLVGGCCGTDEHHIAAMRQALDTPGENRVVTPRVSVLEGETTPHGAADPPTQLAQALAGRQLVVTVEMRPPKGIAAQKMLAGAHLLQAAGANFLNVADTPLARMRMSAWAAAHLIQDRVGVETILHFPTRGRSLLRVQGDLLAAHAMGIRNLFVTMGDPARIGDYPDALDSYDIVPTGLIQLITQQFNAGVDKAGEALDQPTNFTVGCAVSLQPQNMAQEAKLLAKKIQSGANFGLTQPVFDPEAAQAFLAFYAAEYGPLQLPLIVGIQPLFSLRNAEFLHNEVPGITIPPAYMERLRCAADAQAEGVAIAQELVQAIRPWAQGVYIVPAFGRYDLAAGVLDVLRA